MKPKPERDKDVNIIKKEFLYNGSLRYCLRSLRFLGIYVVAGESLNGSGDNFNRDTIDLCNNILPHMVRWEMENKKSI